MYVHYLAPVTDQKEIKRTCGVGGHPTRSGVNIQKRLVESCRDSSSSGNGKKCTRDIVFNEFQGISMNFNDLSVFSRYFFDPRPGHFGSFLRACFGFGEPRSRAWQAKSARVKLLSLHDHMIQIYPNLEISNMPFRQPGAAVHVGSRFTQF